MRMIRTTYTVVYLPVSHEVWQEIADKLLAAGYGHVFMDDNNIDMSGIAIQKDVDQ